MGTTEYFASCVKRISSPILSNRTSNSYEDISSTGHPALDPPIGLGPPNYPKARRIPVSPVLSTYPQSLSPSLLGTCLHGR